MVSRLQSTPHGGHRFGKHGVSGPFQHRAAAFVSAVVTATMLGSTIFAPAAGAASADPSAEAPTEAVPAEEPAQPAPAPEPTTTPEPAQTPDAAPTPDADPTADAAASASDAGDASAEPLDPLSQEAPGESPPESDVTVPPPEEDGTEDLWEPARILWSSVGAAEKKLAETNEQRAETIASARVLRKRQKELTVESQQLGAESAATVAELAAATDRFRERAVLGFQQFGSGSEQEETPDFSDYHEIVDDQRRSRMVDSALKFDQVDLDRLAELQGRLDSNSRAVLDRIRVVSDHLAEVEAEVAELDEVIDQATVEYEAFLAGSQIFIHGAVFPIAPGYDTNLIDSWGFPRMVGTEDEHGHEGIDIFAPRGTPLVAAERGVIERLGVGRLGGLKFWIRGESGSDWYYAHLDSFAPGLANGQVVETGELLGYVGDTGNAVGTPPHLHLQLHPGGGDPVNPYPLLQVISDLEQAEIAAGTFDGYDYSTVVSERQDPPPESTTTSTEATVPETEGPVEPTVPEAEGPPQPTVVVDDSPASEPTTVNETAVNEEPSSEPVAETTPTQPPPTVATADQPGTTNPDGASDPSP
jgi:murein DD-endopeptidase MepM/ murein hydrolase activator NlpD